MTTIKSPIAPRAGLEPAAYCLGGKPEPGQTTPPRPYVAPTCDDNCLTTPDTALRLLTLAPSLALNTRTVQDTQHRNVVTAGPPRQARTLGTYAGTERAKRTQRLSRKLDSPI
jgi:hypothetical protein